MTNEKYEELKIAAKMFGKIELSLDELKELSPIVHCVDCVHRNQDNGHCDCVEIKGTVWGMPVADNYFCKYGEQDV